MSTPQHRIWFLLTAALLWTLCIFILRPAQAQSPADYPTTPVLRPETGMHTAPVRHIDVDRDERFLVSGAEDKAVRVWDLASGRLLRTLRVPLGEGDLGKVYAVAISPDGSTVAVGGYMGKDAASNLIYIFDRATGVLRHRRGGFRTSSTTSPTRRMAGIWQRSSEKPAAYRSMRRGHTVKWRGILRTVALPIGPRLMPLDGW